MNIFIQKVSEYLDATTIHGLIYLKNGVHLIEKVLWFLIITSCLIFSGFLIYNGMLEAYENPILTIIEKTSIRNVPFPAITVNSEFINPWGYSEKILNNIAFDYIDIFNSSKLNNELLVIVNFLISDMMLKRSREKWLEKSTRDIWNHIWEMHQYWINYDWHLDLGYGDNIKVTSEQILKRLAATYLNSINSTFVSTAIFDSFKSQMFGFYKMNGLQSTLEFFRNMTKKIESVNNMTSFTEEQVNECDNSSSCQNILKSLYGYYLNFAEFPDHRFLS